jgi:steroid delta-isomerase-like uncharacterized protein
MSLEANKALVRRWYDEVWNHQHLNLLDELYAPTWVGHFPQGLELRGPADHKRFGAVFTVAFPDARYAVEAVLAEEDLVASRYAVRATHRGELRGIPPTGKAVFSTGINIHRVAAGQIVEQWSQYDMLGLLQQVGAVPAPDAADDRPGEEASSRAPPSARRFADTS